MILLRSLKGLVKERMSKHKKQTVNYVNNKELHAEMLKYRELPEDKRIISDKIGDAIMKISKGLSFKGNFIGYTYKDEMVDDAIENCIYAVRHFDPYKYNNPHAYFTMVAWRAFIRRIQLEKKQTYIKHKNFQNGYDNIGSAPNEYSHAVIESFEKKLTEQKKKSKKGLLALVDGNEPVPEIIEEISVKPVKPVKSSGYEKKPSIPKSPVKIWTEEEKAAWKQLPSLTS